VAADIMDACRDAGLLVPEQIAVLGVDSHLFRAFRKIIGISPKTYRKRLATKTRIAPEQRVVVLADEPEDVRALDRGRSFRAGKKTRRGQASQQSAGQREHDGCFHGVLWNKVLDDSVRRNLFMVLRAECLDWMAASRNRFHSPSQP
jgi:hypothetical protein